MLDGDEHAVQPATTRRPVRAPVSPPSTVRLAVVGLVALVCVAATGGIALLGTFARSTTDAVRIEVLSGDRVGSAAARAMTPDAGGPFLSAPDEGLERVVRTTLAGRIDHYSVVVKELAQGTGIAVNAEREFYAASLFKLAVMYEAFRQAEAGDLPLSTELTVTEAALRDDLGTLEKVQLEVGDRLSVGRLIELMVVFSDNTASVLLRDTLGRGRIDQTLRSLGLKTTSVNDPDLPTTAIDMAILAEAIATSRGVSDAASRDMIAMLREQTVRGRVPAGVPPGVPVANKTGTWEDVGHDVAIVYAPSGTYLVAVLSDLTVRDDLIAELSREIYTYYAGRGR
jgi:beta-lactamase class A